MDSQSTARRVIPHPHRCPGCGERWECNNWACIDPDWTHCERRSRCEWPPPAHRPVWRKSEGYRAVHHDLRRSAFVLEDLGSTEMARVLLGVADTLKQGVDELQGQVVAERLRASMPKEWV